MTTSRDIIILVLGGLAALAAAPGAALGSDYATTVVGYAPGTGTMLKDYIYGIPFSEPAAALGRPTIDTTDDPFPGYESQMWPVLPVYAPFRIYPDFVTGEAVYEIVSITKGGWLVLEFDHPVIDDPRNPAGIDFIVFGNAKLQLLGENKWANGDPTVSIISNTLASDEQGVVSVSQTGLPDDWYTFSQPRADSWAPTLGRVCRPPSQPGGSWWAEATDPTLPLNPALIPGGFNGQTVAQAASTYGYSAGGTAFDLSAVGLSWFRYVRIECPADSVFSPEIDAVSDVRAFAFPDLDWDTDVDAADRALLEGCATGPALGPPRPGCERADFDGDSDVDQADVGIWQRCLSGSDVLANLACMGAGD